MSTKGRNLSCMTNEELLAGTRAVLVRERSSLVEFIECLIEIERRRLHLVGPHGSLFKFCVEALGLSEDQAFRRVRCAKAAARYPKALEMLAKGELSPSGLAKLATFLTSENHEQLLDEARNQPKRSIERMIAKRFGRQPTPTKVEPTANDRYDVRFSMSDHGKRLLDRAKELRPGEDAAVLLEEALGLLVSKLEKQKFKTTDKPRKTAPTDAPSGERAIPDAVCREVAKRDQCRCAYVARDGRRCGERSGLEFDHVVPVGRGGKSTVDNVRLLCAGHHRLITERTFGRAHIQKKIRTKSLGPGQVDVPPDVRPALRALGFGAAESAAMVDRVRRGMPPDANDRDWVKAALHASRAG